MARFFFILALRVYEDRDKERNIGRKTNLKEKVNEAKKLTPQ
jgi:hypothetical protein